jgi:hypothetical protein
MHVLRPGRFLTGDLKRAIQTIPAIAGKAVVIAAVKLPREQADEVELKLLNLVRKHSGTAWAYGSDVVGFTGQLGFALWHHARALAAYRDHPHARFLIFGRHPFDKGYRPQEHPALFKAVETRKTALPNLVVSHDNKGYFFPVKLAFPVQTQWGYIGSTLGLLHEITKLEAIIQGVGYWHAEVERVIEFLKGACASSIALCLPIIIDG